MRREYLFNIANVLQVDFNIAQSKEDYQVIHEGCYNNARGLQEIGSLDLIFGTYVLAADCAFFASSTCEGELYAEKLWLQTALTDLVMASSQPAPDANAPQFQQFVNLIASVINRPISEPLLDSFDPEIQEQLHKLAGNVEVLIPVDFQYSFEPLSANDATNKTAHNLAVLSFKYGNKAVGDTRMYAIARRAEEMKDFEALVRNVFDHYKLIRDNSGDQQQLPSSKYYTRAS